ncbi:MAG TPA: hypothetical protein VFG86_23365 [Chloroflexota bacterium]|nr:hypothetical protein [Chloroflexota bacterium]
MKATSILLVLMVLAMAMAAAVAAQPVSPVAALHGPAHSTEPIWMVLSGTTLLVLASAVRRYIP